MTESLKKGENALWTFINNVVMGMGGGFGGSLSLLAFVHLLIALSKVYRVVHPKSDIGVYIKVKSLVRLHGHVMCHINGNFVGFQNMYDLKMSDY